MRCYKFIELKLECLNLYFESFFQLNSSGFPDNVKGRSDGSGLGLFQLAMKANAFEFLYNVTHSICRQAQ